MNYNMQTKKFEEKIVGLTLFSIITMYLKLIPNFGETQPLLFTILLYILVLIVFYKAWIVIDFYDLIALYLILMLISYYFFSINLPGKQASLIKYIIGPVTFIILRRNITSISKRALILITIVLLILGLLTVVKLRIFINFLTFFMDRIPSTYQFPRAIATLVPEPSYYGITTVILLISTDQVPMSKAENIFVKFTLTALTILSLSALNFMLMLIYWGPHLKNLSQKTNLKTLITYFVILSLTFLSIKYLPNSRFIAVAQSIIDLINKRISFFDFINSVEASGSTRIILNLIGFSGLFSHPFGSGLGTFPAVWVMRADELGIDITNHFVLNQLKNTTTYAQTYFSNLANDTGIFSLAMLLFFLPLKKKASKVDRLTVITIKFMLTVFWFFQCQISNPVPWIALSILYSQKNFPIIRNTRNE